MATGFPLDSWLPPLRDALGELASPVDFTALAGVKGPQGACWWRSSYGLLLLLPVSPEPAPLKEDAEGWAHHLGLAWAQGQARLNDSRRALARAGQHLDGYLLLALPCRPTGELLRSVHQIETDTSGCRKHILWPQRWIPEAPWRSALERVTCLALPRADARAAAAVAPEADPIIRIIEQQSAKKAREQLQRDFDRKELDHVAG